MVVAHHHIPPPRFLTLPLTGFVICSVYGEPIPVKELAERVASYVHLCTLYWWLRFVGTSVAVLIPSSSFFNLLSVPELEYYLL